jgi:hypothetical protein
VSGWCWEWWVRWLLTVLLRLGWAGLALEAVAPQPTAGWLVASLRARHRLGLMVAG